MGSDSNFIPITKAAQILGRTVGQVRDLLDQGLMKWKTDPQGVVVVDQIDLAEIHRLNLAGEIKPGELIRRLVFCERQVERLQLAVDLLMEVNNLVASRFTNMSDSDLMNLHDNARDAAGEKEWATDQMIHFCEVFSKISEIEIDRLDELLVTTNSWKTFYHLCIEMTRQVGAHPQLKTDLNLQRVRDLLYIGRKNLATIAVLFIEKSAQLGPSRKLLLKTAAVDIDLFDQLAKQLRETSHKGHLEIS